MSGNLTSADYAIIVLYLLGTVGLGLFIGRRIRTGADYFLGSRRLPWWAIGMSLVATDIGGTDIIGVGGAAYAHGMAVANFEWIGCVPAMIVAAFVFMPYFYRTGIYTVPEFMERRYNAGVRSALAFCWLAFMACNLGIMLYASAKMLVVMLDWQRLDTLFGWNYVDSLFGAEESACIWFTAALVGIYTFAGGLAAVVYTDTIQCGVMIGGCLLVLAFGLWEIGGVGALREELRALEQPAVSAAETSSTAAPLNSKEGAHRRSPDISAWPEPPAKNQFVERSALVLPVDTETPFPWTGIFFGLALILSPAYWIGNQAIVQRSLGAKSEFQAKAAYVWGALLKNLIPFLIAVPGLIAVVRYPDLESVDHAFPALVSELLPVGLRGLFLAAFIAALMSSIDSYLNSAATILTNDLYKRFIRPAASEEHLLRVGRLTTLALVGWAVFFAHRLVSVGDEGGIYAVFQTLMSFFQGPALAILMCGLLWRRATGVAALVAFVTGVLFSIGLYSLNQEAVYTALGLQPLFRISEPYLYFSVWAFLWTFALLIVISMLTRPEPDEKVRHLIYHRGGKD